MKLSERTDEELVEMAQNAANGDLRAYDLLVTRWQERVLANCRYLTRSPDDSEDLAQEVFVKGFFHLSKFEGRSTFGTWIRRIKVNHCLNFLRSKKNRTMVDADDEIVVSGAPEMHVAPTAVQQTENLDRQQAIRQVLDAMPDTLRLPLLMRDLPQRHEVLLYLGETGTEPLVTQELPTGVRLELVATRAEHQPARLIIPGFDRAATPSRPRW